MNTSIVTLCSGLVCLALTTPAQAADTTPPSSPVPVAEAQTPHTVYLHWNAATDPSGIKGYGVLRNGALIAKTSGTQYTNSGLTPATSYSYTLITEDKAGNRSQPSTPVVVQTPPPDTIAPTPPTGLKAVAVTSTSISLAWTAATDASGIEGYGIVRGGNKVGETSGLKFTERGLTPNTTYVYMLKARDKEGNLSAYSSSLTVTTPPLTAAVLNVRVEGLALGGQLQLAHGTATLLAKLNGPLQFPVQTTPGLDLRIAMQPVGQSCAVSANAPAMVPTDGSPVFVRCRYLSSATRVIQPETLPNEALAVNFKPNELAFPGMPYDSRPGVIGGIFPYEYRLKSVTLNGVAVSGGVALDFRRGTIRFTPQQEGSYVLTVEIRDSGTTQKTLTTSFTITSAAANFLFVASNGLDSSGRGTRELPYKTLAYALAHSTPQQAIVLRKGTYVTGGFSLDDSRAKQLLAWPDEVVTLDLVDSGIGVHSNNAPPARIEGFDLTRIKQYGIVSDPTFAGLVIRNIRFLDGKEGATISENPAFIHGWGDNTPNWRHKLLVQDNDFGTYTMNSSGSGYAMTLFDAGESLIENNQLHLGATKGGIHDKDNSQHNTYRENYIEFSDANANGSGIQISAQANSDRVHIHHNLLVNAGITLGVQCFQSDCYMREHNVHHNTLVNQGINMNWGPFNPTSSGTRLTHNIISSRSKSPYGGLSCQGSLPVAFDTQLTARANLLETSHALAFKDNECTGRDMTWAQWWAHGMDTSASGSTVTAGSALVGAGPLTGLPAADSRRGTRGHQHALPATDSSAPTAPSGLVLSAVTANTLTLEWTASSDNVGVVRYDLYRDGVLAGTSSTSRFSYTGLTAGSRYSLTLKAVDAAGNQSAVSPALTAKTSAAVALVH